LIRAIMDSRSNRMAILKHAAHSTVVLVLTLLVAVGYAEDGKSQSTVQGTVHDGSGAPVAAATVHITARGESQNISVQTDATGSYRRSSLGAGEYNIRVEKSGYNDANFGPFSLREGQSTTVELTLKAASEKSGSHPPEAPQFFDQPQFTVAGVTDASNHGGHGSDAVSRTTQTLTHDVTTLNAQPVASPAAAETEASLRGVLAHDPGNFEANRRLGTLLVASGKSNEALPFLEQAHQFRQDDPESARELAKAYAAVGKNREARGVVEAQLARQDSADLHHLLADLEEKEQHPLAAVREYQRAAELDPSESNLFDWGTELLTHRALQPAIEIFTRGVHLYPKSPRMLVGLGVASYASGSAEQAANYICQASDLNPTDPNPYGVLGKIAVAEAAISSAVVERMARFHKLHPESSSANYYYAVALWKQTRKVGLEETLPQVQLLLDKARQLDPKLASASLQLGILYEEHHDLPRAIAAYQEAVATDSQIREAHYRLAQIYRRTGEKQKAEQELAAYNRISRQVAAQNEREAHEIPQFVYTLRDSKSPVPPQ
jgi:tetratricopeptide (TPR) repeat protein